MGGLFGGLRFDAAFEHPAGHGVDFEFVFRAAGAELDFIHAHAVVLFKLRLGEGHVAGGQTRAGERDALGAIHADIGSGILPRLSARLDALFANRAGRSVDFVFVFRVVRDEFDLVHAHAVLIIELQLGNGRLRFGQTRVRQRGAARVLAGKRGGGQGLAGARGFVLREALDAHAADRAGGRVNVVFVFRVGRAEGNLVQPESALRVALDLRAHDGFRRDARVRQRGGKRARLVNRAAALLAHHFQRLFGIQLPRILHNRAVLGADPVFILKAAETEFHVVHSPAAARFGFNGKPAHVRLRHARGLQRQRLRARTVDGGLRRAEQRERQKRRKNGGNQFLFHGVLPPHFRDGRIIPRPD